MQPGQMQRLSRLEFIYVTGKGGVGKSTVAAALASALGNRGRRVLLTYPSDALGQERLLGRPGGSTPTRISPGFYALAVDTEAAMRQYVESILVSRRLTSLVLSNRVAAGFLRGIPGLSAWAFLGKSWFHADPVAHGARPGPELFDTVIVDAPATGDGTEMLEVPRVILDLAPVGRLRDDAEHCLRLLADPLRAAAVVVTLPDPLVFSETEELVHALTSRLRVPLAPLLCNRVETPLFDEALGERLANLPLASVKAATTEDTPSETLAAAVLDRASERARTEASARRVKERLAALGHGYLELPEQPEEPRGPSALSALGRLLAEHL